MSDFLRFHINQLKNDSDTVKVLVQESMDPSLHKLEWINKTIKGIPGIFSKMLESAKKRGEVRDIDTDIIGTTIFLASNALAYKLQLEGRESECDYAMEQLYSFIINGIKK